MSGAQKRAVESQLALLVGGKSVDSSDLLSETEWKLLETVCYESARIIDNLQESDLERAIPEWRGKSFRDLHKYPYSQKNVPYLIKRLKRGNFTIPSLNRYRIFKAQLEECKTARNVDWNSMLPETIREVYKLMCLAAYTLPLDVKVDMFSVPIPELGKSLSDLGFLTWYFRKNNCRSLGYAVRKVKENPKLKVKDLSDMVIEERRRKIFSEKIEKYKSLNWREELVVSKKKRYELRKNAKSNRIYKRFENVPNFTAGKFENLVGPLTKGDPTAKKLILRRYSRMVAQRALHYVGMGIEYTKLVKYGIQELEKIIESYDFKGEVKFPVYINREIPSLLEKAARNASLVVRKDLEKPRDRYKELVLEFLRDFKDALEEYSLELEPVAKDGPRYQPKYVATGKEKEVLINEAQKYYNKTSKGGRGSKRRYADRVAQRAISFVGIGINYRTLIKYVLRNTTAEERKNTSRAYALIDGKIRSAIRLSRNRALNDSIEDLTNDACQTTNSIKKNGLTYWNQKRLDDFLRLLGQIASSNEYCIRAYYGLGDTRNDLQVCVRLPLEEISEKKFAGCTTKESVRYKHQAGFREMAWVHMQSPN